LRKAEESFREDLARKIGVELRTYGCENDCYLKGRLEESGCMVKCESINHDFGQPVDNLDEASRFLCWQLKLEERYVEKISKYAQDYIIERDGVMYIPIKRNSCVLVFER